VRARQHKTDDQAKIILDLWKMIIANSPTQATLPADYDENK
jgi:hypothetical protein